MQFDFSEDQELMRDEARKLLARESTSSRVRAVLESDQAFDRDLWALLADQGWQGIAVSEQQGGAGAGYLELCVLAEELGRALAPVPYSSSVFVVAEALKMATQDDVVTGWLARLASGEAIGCFAIAEGGGGGHWASLKTAAEGADDGCTVTGEKPIVIDGMAAQIALVAAQSGGEAGLYLVELDQDRVRRGAVAGIDESRPLASLSLERARAHRLDGVGQVEIDRLLDRAATLMAFEQLGGAAAALEMGVEYAKQRYAFGRQIGSFQAIKHKLADLYAELELTRSNCFMAAWALSSDDASLPEAAASARLSASKLYFVCAKENIQVHGGMGFTWELDGHLHYRRARLLSAALGGSTFWRERLIKSLTRRNSHQIAAA